MKALLGIVVVLLLGTAAAELSGTEVVVPRDAVTDGTWSCLVESGLAEQRGLDDSAYLVLPQQEQLDRCWFDR